MKSVSQMQIKDQGYEQVNVSCETGTGIDELVETLCDKVGFHPPENSLIARTRHIDALRRTADYLAEAHRPVNSISGRGIGCRKLTPSSD